MTCPTLRGSAVESMAWKHRRIWICSCAEVTCSGWNLRSNTEFLPAVDEINDEIKCIQSAFDVRPLGLKNCDRAVCAVMNDTLSASVAKQTCECQKGLMRSDAASELHRSWCWGKKHGRLDHSFEGDLWLLQSSIWTVLRTMLLPVNVLQLCQSIYHMNDKFTHLGNTWHTIRNEMMDFFFEKYHRNFAG